VPIVQITHGGNKGNGFALCQQAGHLLLHPDCGLYRFDEILLLDVNI
jgi:hypothetical protein